METIHPIAVVGSTGTGKTALALYIAQYLIQSGYSCAIINMDSRQVYKAFPLVSAQPSAKEQYLVPHYYYGYLSLNARLHVEEYVENIASLCRKLWQHKTIPILVGGTGMYFYTLCNGIAPIPNIKEEIRNIQRTKVKNNIEEAYQELVEHDPFFAASITQGDSQRIARGLEVFYSTGVPLSEWHKEKKQCMQIATSIGIIKPKSILNEHLLERIHQMIAQGAIEEVNTVIKEYSDATQQAFSCIGVQEIMSYLNNTLSKEECIEQWLIHTRQYAKRQRTWFKNKHSVHWVNYTSYAKEVNDILHTYLRTFLV